MSAHHGGGFRTATGRSRWRASRAVAATVKTRIRTGMLRLRERLEPLG